MCFISTYTLLILCTLGPCLVWFSKSLKFASSENKFSFISFEWIFILLCFISGGFHKQALPKINLLLKITKNDSLKAKLSLHKFNELRTQCTLPCALLMKNPFILLFRKPLALLPLQYGQHHHHRPPAAPFPSEDFLINMMRERRGLGTTSSASKT